MFKQNILYLFFLLFALAAQAQKDSYVLQVFFQEGVASDLKKISYKKQHSDSLSASKELQKFIQAIQQNSYLMASVESRVFKKDSLIAQIHTGENYTWEKLSKGNVKEVMLNQIAFKDRNYQNKSFVYSEIEILKQKILTYSENHGFPFATIHLDSLRLENQKISASLNYQSGPFMVFDTLKISGNARIKTYFLERYLKISPKQAFNQARVDNTLRLIKQLPYLRSTQKPMVEFDSVRAFVNLFINKKKSNQIDGILGLLPNEEAGNSVLLTGEFNLDLKNLFYSGKNLKARWQRLQTASQSLNLEYEHPVLFKSNLDLKLSLELLKQDSSFVTIERQFNLIYNLQNTGRLSFLLNYKTSRLGQATRFSELTELPDFLETSFFSYGLGYEWNNLDDYFYPHQGNRFNLSANFGTKKILKSPLLADSLYNELILNTTQVVLKSELYKYFPLSPKTTFLTKLSAGIILNENLFLNDLFRVGGLTSLRGFNQNFFYASVFGIATLEYRFFLEGESYFFLFYDQAFRQQKLRSNFTEDYPLGAGLGLSFALKAGLFNLVYALGKSAEQNLSFSRSKIHFGLISRF